MATEYINIIETVDDAVIGSRLFLGEHDTIVPLAEEHFLALCKENNPEFDEENDKEDIECILEDGYYSSGNYSVFLNWPDVKDYAN